MTATRRASGLPTRTVFLDTWAWWEVLHDTPTGRRLARRYVEAPDTLVYTVDVALAEVACKLARVGRGEEIGGCLETILNSSEVVPITKEIAVLAGPLLLELRGEDSDASGADAVMLAAARTHHATLVSADPCYRGQSDVTEE